jgi:hypothetical protein
VKRRRLSHKEAQPATAGRSLETASGGNRQRGARASGPRSRTRRFAPAGFVGHLPSAILILPKPVSRSPPETSSMYPSSIRRVLCSTGMRCIKPLAPSRNETNSSRVNGGDKFSAMLRICAYGCPVQAGHPAAN